MVVRQRRKELMFGLLENSSNSLLESDIFRQEEDEICHIPVETSKKSDIFSSRRRQSVSDSY